MQQPWIPQPPPPPQRSGTSTGLIVLAIVLPLLILFFAGAGMALFMFAAKKSAARAASTPVAASAITESYTAKNALVVAHYPSDFAAKSPDDDTITLQKNLGDGSADLVQIAAVVTPISDDVNEFGRVLIRSMVKDIESYGDKWYETGRSSKACYKSYAGLEVTGWFMARGTTKTNVTLCFFMATTHGYMIKTIVPAKHEMRETATLQAIADATELK